MGTWPHVLAYAVNIALSVIALALLPRHRDPAAQQVRGQPRRRPADHRPRASAFPVHRPAGRAVGVRGRATAYAIIPSLMTDKTSSAPIAFAGLCCLLGLGVGFGIRSSGGIARPGTVRGAVLSRWSWWPREWGCRCSPPGRCRSGSLPLVARRGAGLRLRNSRPVRSAGGAATGHTRQPGRPDRGVLSATYLGFAMP